MDRGASQEGVAGLGSIDGKGRPGAPPACILSVCPLMKSPQGADAAHRPPRQHHSAFSSLGAAPPPRRLGPRPGRDWQDRAAFSDPLSPQLSLSLSLAAIRPLGFWPPGGVRPQDDTGRRLEGRERLGLRLPLRLGSQPERQQLD